MELWRYLEVDMKITDISWRKIQSIGDDRGYLSVIEGGQTIPFDVKRVFYMHDVAQGADRGGHAHRDTDQFAVAVHGSLKIVVSDGFESRVVVLDNPAWGVTLPRLTWTRLMNFSEGAVCLVLASTHYDISKSIRTWPEYLAERGVPECQEVTTGPVLDRPIA
jgi:dTDP-4-dehydrorhamnose 3,5-epimerase-like enzyme